MMSDNTFAALNNSLILGKILENFGKKELLILRTISKAFDSECIRVYTKQNYGRWVDGNEYYRKVEKLLKESRHPKLLLGKIKLNTCHKFNLNDKFIKIVTSNSEHVKGLSFYNCPFKDAISILNECCNIEELRFRADVFDKRQFLSTMNFKFKNLSGLEFRINGEGTEREESLNILDVLIKNIVTASEKLRMLSFEHVGFYPSLKNFLEDELCCKKISLLKTLHVDDCKDAKKVNRESEVDNVEQLAKLILLVKKSIVNLHFSNPNWKWVFEEWPEMPNLTTMTWHTNVPPPDISEIPSKDKTPKLKLLLVGHCMSTNGVMWRQGDENHWIRNFDTDKKVMSFEHGKTITVVVLFWRQCHSEGIVNLLKDLRVEQLFLNTKSFGYSDLSKDGRILLECIHYIPSLTRVVARTEQHRRIKVLDIPVDNS